MFYKILSQSTPDAELSISKKSKIANAYKDGSIITLLAGSIGKKVTINITDKLEKDTIKVSTKVINDLSIRQGDVYQLIGTNKRIRIGPIIGLLIFTKKSSITSRALKRMFDYTLSYDSMKGILYVFSVDSIDFTTKTVNGFCYNSSKHIWEEGIFPFPDAIYRRVSMSKKTINLIQTATRNHMYNSLHFNKLDFWNMASSSKEISEHIPMTKVYKSIQDINEMLKSYKILFLKPINSTRAFGLMRITKNGMAYSIQEKMAEKPELFTSKEEASSYIDTFRKDRNYLVQEGIDLLNFDNRYIDFRVIMQKDHLLKWQCTGIITSMGKKGGVCSNYDADDKYMVFEAFFNKYFTISKEEIFRKKQEIIMLCKKACKVLDEKSGNYADLGIDVGLDKNLKPWIFEMNNRRHMHEMSLLINDYDAYFRAKTNPVIYGAKLSGFDIL